MVNNIRIVKNGIDLDLSGNEVRWESVNMLFLADAFQGDYSFPFTLPFSPKNLRELGFLHKPEVLKETVSFNVLLFLGSKQHPCKLIINGAKKDGFDSNIASGLMAISNADKLLKDIDYGTRDLDDDFGNMWRIYSATNWELGITFPPHYNPDFYGSANPDFNGVINRNDSDALAYRVNTDETGNKYAFVPFPYLFYMLKCIFSDIGLNISGTFWRDAELSTVLIYNNRALDKKLEQGCTVINDHDQIYIFPLQHILTSEFPLFYDTPPGASDPEDNWNSAYPFKYRIPADGDYAVRLKCTITSIYAFLFSTLDAVLVYEDPDGFTHDIGSETLPFEYTGPHAIVDIAQDFEVIGTISGAEMNGKLYLRIQNFTGDPMAPVPDGTPYQVKYKITSGALLQITRYDIDDFNIMDKDVVISNHVPDMDVKSFLKEVKNTMRTNIVFDWDNNEVVMNLVDKIISGPHEVDYTSVADPYPEVLFDNKNAGYTVTWDFGTRDALIENNFKPYDPKKYLGEFTTRNDLPTPYALGYFCLVKNKNKIAIVDDSEGPLGWAEYSDNYYPVVVGKGATEYKLQLAPMMMTDGQTNESGTGDTDHEKCLMPTISETGSSPLFNLGDNPASLRFVFMRGINQDTTIGGEYVLASSTNFDLNGNQVGNYNLKLQGSGNWYTLFLEKLFIALDNSEVYEYLIMLTASDLRFKSKIQIRNVNYLMKQTSMLFGKTIKQSVVKLLKL